MASSSSTNLAFSFLACLFLFTFSTDNLVAGESEKVKVNVYCDSLCPHCQSLIVNDLVEIFKYDFDTIIDLKLIPFGNAHALPNLTVTCQHGEEECNLNALEACIIKTWPETIYHYMIIRCIENDTTNWKSCVEAYGREEEIYDCYNSDLSKKLILGYANETLSLKPPHTFVPWITVDGEPAYDNMDDFVPDICKAYKGKAALPKRCNSSASHKKKVSKLQVCYAD